MIAIARELPRQDDVIALIRQSDALMQSLYPAESNHLVDVESLAAFNVHFLVARGAGAGARLRRLRAGRSGPGGDEARIRRSRRARQGRRARPHGSAGARSGASSASR